MPSLLYDASGDLANCGSGATIDDMTAMSALIWFYPVSTASNRQLMAKSDGGTLGWNWGFSGTSGALVANWRRATTNATRTSSTTSANDAWNCYAFTADQGATPVWTFYFGNLTTMLVEAGYSATNNGSGAFQADNTFDLHLGNRTGADQGVRGRYGFAALWNRVLTLGELRAQQFSPHPTSGCVGFWWPGVNGTTSIPDWSGKFNPASTLTGLVTAPGLPLDVLFESEDEDPYVVTAGGATSSAVLRMMGV